MSSGISEKLPQIEVEKYLMRLACPYEKTPTLRYLKTLHKSHILHIPFENLDIHLGNEIILDIRKIYDKVMTRHRGGFCYELNGLFFHLLSQLGYRCHLISARGYDHDTLGPEFDHMAILVYLEHQVYLVDVGFGDLFLEPKLVQPGKVQMDYNQYFRIDKTIEGDYTLNLSSDSFEYKPKYLFSKEERQYIEFIDMCRYHQTNEKSLFRKKKMITKATPEGRITLTDSMLTIRRLGGKEEQKILNQDEFKVKLYQHFGIRLVKNG